MSYKYNEEDDINERWHFGYKKLICYVEILVPVTWLTWLAASSITNSFPAQWEKLYTFRNSFVKVLHKLNRKFESQIHVVKLFPLNFASQKPLQFT